MRCGDTGYPKGFGARYCAKFQGLCGGALTTANARAWVRGTTACLQRSLADVELDGNSCDAITGIAFDSHPFCYTSGAAAISGVSFCMLRLTEWNSIRGCIDLADTLSISGLRQAAVTATRCSLFFAGGLLLDESGTDAQPDAATQRLIDTMTPAERQARAKEMEAFAQAIYKDIPAAQR
jgi:hypothetical protein